MIKYFWAFCASSWLFLPPVQKIEPQNMPNCRDGVARVVVTHRLATLGSFDKVIFLVDGKVKGTGTLAQLLETVPEFQGEDLAPLTTAVTQGWLDVKSTTFRIRAEGITPRYGVRRVVELLVARPADGAPSTVVRWYET